MRRRKPPKISFGIVVLFLAIGLCVLLWWIAPFFKKAPPPLPVKGKIAIVLDDWGYHAELFDYLSQIREPVTLAILPHLAYSKNIATRAHNLGLEVILHMPMEPHPREGLQLEEDTLMADMGRQEILRILEKSLDDIPGCKGVSNHMGSRFTEDEARMEIVLGFLKKKGLYFLDSFVTSTSQAEAATRRVGVRFYKRSVFLDNQRDVVYIKRQITKLAKVAQDKGQAVGIGHETVPTLQALKEMLPLLRHKGFKIVFLSQLKDAGFRY